MFRPAERRQIQAGAHRVETRRLNEQVRRNKARFPQDFIFELTPEELPVLQGPLACRRRSRPPYSVMLRLLPGLGFVGDHQRAPRSALAEPRL